MGPLRCATTLVFVLLAGAAGQAQDQPLRLIQTIPMPHVKGRIDHMDADVSGRRLFVAGLDNGSVEVVDLKRGKWQRSIPGFKKPQGILYVGSLNKLFVASGDDAMLRVFKGDTLQPAAEIRLEPGPNRVIYDPESRELYVGYGGKDAGKDYGVVGIIDAGENRQIADIKVAAHPAELLLDRGRLFALIPTATHLQVIDRKTRQVTATWSTNDARPGDAAFDPATHRIFVGTKKPAQLLVLDSQSGKQMAAQPTIDGMDGVYFDTKRKRIYVSGSTASDSSVWVYQQRGPDNYELLGKVPTRDGAATALWVPEMNRYYVAAPATGDKQAAVLVLEPGK